MRSREGVTTVPAPAPPRSLVRRIAAAGPAVVALSGGVDSAVVARLAFEALGPAAHAITLTGPAVSRDERDRATASARSIGIDHRFLEADPLAVVEYRANAANRCFFCRRTESAVLRDWGRSHGIQQYLDGVHLDDLGDERPGLRALDEAGFVHPLAAAGWRKTDVRRYARSAGLPGWDAPSDACLASRVAHGQAISAPLLARIAAAESAVRALGFRRVRVRTTGTDARVEVDPTEVERLLSSPIAERARAEVAAAGFAPVTLDPAGYHARAGA